MRDHPFDRPRSVVQRAGFAALAVLLTIAPAPALANPTPLTIEEICSDRLLSRFPIGGSSLDAAHRTMGWGIPWHGWTPFVQRQIQPQIAAGVRRFDLHNPFGTLPGEAMQFDQALHAADAGLNMAIDDFVQAWRPITQAPGPYRTQVIAYLGSIPLDDQFTQLEDDPNAWYTRAWDSARLPLRAGMSIGFDAWTDGEPDDLVYRFSQALKGAGVKIYLEPRPKATATHLFDENLIANDPAWTRFDPVVNPGGGFAPTEALTGEVIRMLRSEPYENGDSWFQKFNEWGPDVVRKILADGHTVGFNAALLLQDQPAASWTPPAPPPLTGPNVLIHNGQFTITQGALSVGDIDLEASALIDVVGEMRVNGNFSHAMTDASRWRFADGSTFRIAAHGRQVTLEVAGRDRGEDPLGFDGNFSLARLLIDSGITLRLIDLIDNQPGDAGAEALYVDVLEFEDASSLLLLDGVNIYYGSLIGEVSQVRDAGEIVVSDSPTAIPVSDQVAPEPGTAGLVVAVGVLKLLRRRSGGSIGPRRA